jgi:hypothetical protein
MSESTVSLFTCSAQHFPANLRKAFAGLALMAGLLSPLGAAAQTASDTTYVFTGTCTDCTGVGVGYLTLQNYTPGTALSYSNFVSFTYQSNLSSISIGSQGMQYAVPDSDGDGGTATFNSAAVAGSVLTVGLDGVLGTTSGPSDFDFEADSLNGITTNSVDLQSSESSGAWQLSTSLAVGVIEEQFPGGKSGQINDYGAAHTWALAAPTDALVIAAPEIDATSATAALTLLLGSLAVLRGRRSLRLTLHSAVG